ncbi:lipid asymmetry maintenance protein MlaB [Streptomyces sp. NPDC048330]|uniref:STAS domain-containing protein n=1 Tax=Streptomyces sp. NPDC048330 TaxID=3365533 RepID=UPI00371483AA
MNITTMITGTTARITPHGEIDFDTLPPLHRVLDRLPLQVTELLWDLEHLSFTDVAGLHLIFGPMAHGRLSCRTTVTNLRDQPLQLLLTAADLFPAAYDVSCLIPHTPADLTAPRA